MISWLGGIIIVVLFILLFKLFRMIDISRDAIALAKASVAVMLDPSLSDLEKEKLAQKNALGLFKAFLLITIAGFSAVFLPVGVIWLLDFVGVMSLDAVLTTMISWPFLLGSTVAGCLAIWLLSKI